MEGCELCAMYMLAGIGYARVKAATCTSRLVLPEQSQPLATSGTAKDQACYRLAELEQVGRQAFGESTPEEACIRRQPSNHSQDAAITCSVEASSESSLLILRRHILHTYVLVGCCKPSLSLGSSR